MRLGWVLALVLAGGMRGQMPKSWTENHAPFRIAGNLYYVGGADLASYLVATKEGLILINSNVPQDVPEIRGNVEKLGFRWRDVKILLISHAHQDHDGGSAEVVRETGAKYEVMDADVPVVESGGRADWKFGTKAENWYPDVKVDRVLHDGDEVRLGGAVLVAHKTAGHTKGTTTWTMRVSDGGRSYEAVIVGSPNVLPQYRLRGDPGYPEQAADFVRGVRGAGGAAVRLVSGVAREHVRDGGEVSTDGRGWGESVCGPGGVPGVCGGPEGGVREGVGSGQVRWLSEPTHRGEAAINGAHRHGYLRLRSLSAFPWVNLARSAGEMGRASRKALPVGVGGERVINGVEEAVGADDLEGTEEGRLGEVAAGGDVEVLREVLRDGALEVFGDGGEDGGGAGERIRKVFAHVADDDLLLREAVKQAGEDEAQAVEAELDVPAPARDGEGVAGRAGQAGVVGVEDGFGRGCGVEVDRHFEGVGGLPEGEKAGIVQEGAAGVAVHKGSGKAEGLDAALKFAGGGCGIGQVEAGEASKAGGMILDGRGEFIVGTMDEGGGVGGRQVFKADGGYGEDLQIDRAGVHVGQADLTEIDEPGLDSLHGRILREELAYGVEEVAGGEVLFERDRAHDAVGCVEAR